MNSSQNGSPPGRGKIALLLAGAVVILWLISHPSRNLPSRSPADHAGPPTPFQAGGDRVFSQGNDSFPRLRRNAGPPESPEEIVAAKLAELATLRRRLVARLAARHGRPVPADVSRFFDALERGDWPAADQIFEELRARKDREEQSELLALWTPVREAQGIQQEVRNWPPEHLIAYAQQVLGALRPGQVFIGGTDPGFFINTLFNETSGGPQHMIFTQNALADSSYLEYLRTVFGDRLNFPSPAGQQAAFTEYIADALFRLEHDRNFPGEPPQIRAGENVALSDDGRVQVSGQVAVMAINERILAKILELNPETSFALEESFSLKSAYLNAAPLGPVIELRAGEENRLTPDRAAESAARWRAHASQLLGATTALDQHPRRAWAHTAAAQANLLLEHHFFAEAGEIYRLALEMDPDAPSAREGLEQIQRRKAAAGIPAHRSQEPGAP